MTCSVATTEPTFSRVPEGDETGDGVIADESGDL
jgi:hypothetical protein